MVRIINEFRGDYYFLSNFYNAPVAYEGTTYKNSEAAFQAAKCADVKERGSFAQLSASDAKRAGRRVKLRQDWETVKYSVMYEIVLKKFEQNDYLRQRLLDTGYAFLEEGNTWGDTTWGTVNGVGNNVLGVILMRVREELRQR